MTDRVSARASVAETRDAPEDEIPDLSHAAYGTGHVPSYPAEEPSVVRSPTHQYQHPYVLDSGGRDTPRAPEGQPAAIPDPYAQSYAYPQPDQHAPQPDQHASASRRRPAEDDTSSK